MTCYKKIYQGFNDSAEKFICEKCNSLISIGKDPLTEAC